MTPAKKMELMNVPGPSRDHWRIFLTVTLRSCPQLVHVDLSRNEAIASTLEPFAALHGSLQYLDVSMSAGFGGTLQPLRGLRKLRELYLYWVRGARRHSGASRELARPRDSGHGGVPWASGRPRAHGAAAKAPVPQRLRHAAGHRDLRVGRLCGRAEVA